MPQRLVECQGLMSADEMSALVRDLFPISKPVNKFLIEIRYDGVRR